uniref:Uncharacterized protein n=1 Tax=Arundo donax TaxID=35708 RepID=A0A0A9FGP8_ARUDO
MQLRMIPDFSVVNWSGTPVYHLTNKRQSYTISIMAHITPVTECKE